MLKGLGCQPTVVADGRQAVNAFCNEGYDVILMDCQMPEMDGYMATVAIRRHERQAGATERIPIVALTADVVGGAQQKCVAAGMDDYLCKPFTGQQLFEILNRWLPEKLPAPGEACADNSPDRGDEAEVIDQRALNNIRQVQKNTDSNVLDRVIDLYYTEAPGLIDALRQAYDKDDTGCLGRTAHKLKSSSSNLGARRLAALCKELEAMGKEGLVKDAEPVIISLEAEYQRVRQALAQEQRESQG